jgi:hypothetical protein
VKRFFSINIPVGKKITEIRSFSEVREEIMQTFMDEEITDHATIYNWANFLFVLQLECR